MQQAGACHLTTRQGQGKEEKPKKKHNNNNNTRTPSVEGNKISNVMPVSGKFLRTAMSLRMLSMLGSFMLNWQAQGHRAQAIQYN
jgi:hypothetical protein